MRAKTADKISVFAVHWNTSQISCFLSVIRMRAGKSVVVLDLDPSSMSCSSAPAWRKKNMPAELNINFRYLLSAHFLFPAFMNKAKLPASLERWASTPNDEFYSPLSGCFIKCVIGRSPEASKIVWFISSNPWETPATSNFFSEASFFSMLSAAFHKHLNQSGAAAVLEGLHMLLPFTAAFQEDRNLFQEPGELYLSRAEILRVWAVFSKFLLNVSFTSDGLSREK